MIRYIEAGGQVRSLIRKSDIRYAGNARLKIYGLLSCPSGKKMRRANRVFFHSEAEALEAGYRPCGRCMHDRYLQWKQPH